MNHSTAYFAGGDWAKHKHDVHLTTADGTDVAHGEFSHTGVGLQAMTDWLRQHAGDAPVTVAIEMPHGAPVTALQHHGFTVASVNPMPVHHDRRHRAMSGAEDDPRDARLLAEMVRRTPDSTRTQTVELDEVVALRATVQHREQRVKDCTALITRLQSQLWEYFPELGNPTDNVSAAWFLDLCDAVSLPGIGTVVLAQRGGSRLRCPRDGQHGRVARPERGGAGDAPVRARNAACGCAGQRTGICVTPCTTWPPVPRSVTPRQKTTTMPFGPEAVATAVPCARWQIGSCESCSPCSATARHLTPTARRGGGTPHDKRTRRNGLMPFIKDI